MRVFWMHLSCTYCDLIVVLCLWMVFSVCVFMHEFDITFEHRCWEHSHRWFEYWYVFVHSLCDAMKYLVLSGIRWIVRKTWTPVVLSPVVFVTVCLGTRFQEFVCTGLRWLFSFDVFLLWLFAAISWSCSVLRSVLVMNAVMQRASIVPGCDWIILCVLLLLHWSLYVRDRVIGGNFRSASDKKNLSWKLYYSL